MPLADFEIVDVMSRRNLETSRPKGHVDIVIGNHWNDAALERQFHLLADDVLIALVFRVYGNSHVTEEGLGTCGGHDEMRQFAFRFDQGVSDVPEIPGLSSFRHFDFIIRECRSIHGAPVHHALATVQEFAIKKGLEGHLHRVGESLIHGEASAAPVTGTAHLLELVDDEITVLDFPFPYFFYEVFTSKLSVIDTLCIQLFSHHRLRGDTCVIRSRYPQSIEAIHSLVANENILNRIVDGVSHVESARHVRWRNDDAEGFLIDFGWMTRVPLLVKDTGERVAFEPEFVDTGLYGAKIIASWYVHGP